jgi:phytoene dehydrogenase-like protein
LRALEDFFGDDPRPKLALAANLGYLHDDPSELWFPAFAVMQGGYLRDGAHYLAGGSRSLTDSLVSVVRSHGGEVVANARATGIELDAQGSVVGVRWVDPQGAEHSPRTRVVLGNAAPAALGSMLPDDARARLLAPYAGLAPSISLFTISLGVSRLPKDFGVSAYSTFVLPDWMGRLEQMKLGASLLGEEPGARLPSYALVDYSRIDTGLNEQGLHLLSLTGADRIENWKALNAEQERARKQQWIAALIADLDRRYPGIAASVEQSEMANAMTMQHFLGTPGGSVYGFAPTVARFSRPPSASTAVPGLFIASAYTTGGGFEGALSGGAMASHSAREYLGAARAQ